MFESLRERPGVGAPSQTVEAPVVTQEERQERRIDAYFDARELQAQGIVRWIRKLEETTVLEEHFSPKYYEGETDYTSDEEIFHDQLEPQIASYPPELQQKFKKAWYRWAVAERTARLAAKEIVGAQEGAPPLDDRQLGERFFQEVANEPPTGPVRFSQVGPLYYLAFENPSDYDAFVKKQGYPGGLREGEGGCFMREAVWRGKKIPTVLQVGTSAKPGLEKHESQHFLQHTMGNLFEEWEPGADGSADAGVISAERETKDEVLAYIRDGSNPGTIYANLAGTELYAHLYRSVGQGAAEQLKGSLKRLCDQLNGHPYMLDASTMPEPDRQTYAHHRELLVASLLDIPFSKMERYVRLSAEHRRRKIDRTDLQPPPLAPGPEATPEERAAFARQREAFRGQYVQMLGVVPEYSFPTQEEAKILELNDRLDAPPSLDADASPSAAQEERERLLKELADAKAGMRVFRRLDQAFKP